MADKKYILMQGNEACLEGAIRAGMRFFAGYPITPSTEIAEQAALRLPLFGGKFLQMEDEISSMAAIVGASCAGAKAMTATSGPGISLMQENIGYASLCEVPCVVVNVQRGGPSTGLPTSPSQGDVMQAKWGTHGDHPIITIAPSSVPECYEQIIRSFNLAEKYRVPVIFLMDEIIGHMREGLTIPEEVETVDRTLPDENDKDWLPYKVDEETLVPSLPPFGDGCRYHVTGLLHDKRGYPTSDPVESDTLVRRLMHKIEKNIDDILLTEEKYTDDAQIAVLCYGGTARPVDQAVFEARKEGIKVGMFRPVTIWPFPEKQLLELSKKVKHIIVAEHNYGQIILEAERIVKDNCELSLISRVNGKVIKPSDVLKSIKEVVK